MSEQQQAEKPRRPFFQRVWREWVMRQRPAGPFITHDSGDKIGE